MESKKEKAVNKKKKKRRKKKDVPEVDPAVLASYYSDPIALWQDGEYEALEALYTQADSPLSGTGRAKGGDDSWPF
jgi:hypothetical protein